MDLTEMSMEITEKERRTIVAVFGTILENPVSELNRHLGSITIEWMQELYTRAKYEPYCRRHGITYEEMDESDFEQAYYEERVEGND